jgi:hypothetical protein
VSVLDLDEFLATIATAERAGDHFVLVDSSTALQGQHLLDIEQFHDGAAKTYFLLTCSRVVSARSTELPATFKHAMVLSDHPILLPYRQPVLELYFAKPPPDPEQIAGKLTDLHRLVLGDWYRPEIFFQSRLPIAERLASGYGVLASGPEALMQPAYVILDEAGCRPSMISIAGKPGFEDPPLVLQLGDAAVVAGASFRANRTHSRRQATEKRIKLRGW